MEQKSLAQRIYNYFDKLEDKIRAHLSKSPLIYTLIGGVSIVFFWRGVWHTGDLLEAQGGILGILFSPQASLIFGAITLMVSGLFVSFFVGDASILSGIKKEEKMIQKTEHEMRSEGEVLESIERDITHLESRIEEFEKKMTARKPLYPQSVDKGQ